MSSKTVVESAQFGEEKAAIGVEVKRLGEILHGIVWALERDPRRFPQIRGTRLHRVLTDPFPDAPPVRVWYTYNILTQEVELLSIERVDGDENIVQVALQLATVGRDAAVDAEPDPAA
jgi:hypothetical protein